MVGIGHSGEFPNDQQKDDEQSLTFATPPFEDVLNIVGQPRIQLTLSSDKPVANLVARLSDVHPSGESTLITYGVLNLTHRSSHEAPRALIPGKAYSVELALNHIAYQIPKGHQLRLAISNAYWPLIWPSPFKDSLSIQLPQSKLRLPCKHSLAGNSNPALDEFSPAETSTDKELRPAQSTKTIIQDGEDGELRIKTDIDYGRYFHLSCETEIDFTLEQLLTIQPDDPGSAKSVTDLSVEMQQGDLETALNGHYEMTSTNSHYYVKAHWEAWEGRECIFDKDFDVKIKRNLI